MPTSSKTVLLWLACSQEGGLDAASFGQVSDGNDARFETHEKNYPTTPVIRKAEINGGEGGIHIVVDGC